MSFYHSLASYYDELFPLNPKSLHFVYSYLKKHNNYILDIGCATGQLALKLAADRRTARITAIEPDEKMVKAVGLKIKERHLHDSMDIFQGGMLELDTLFPSQSFDLILCLGNTLVHLPTLRDIGAFFASVSAHLNTGGVFIFQIVNYTRILSQDVRELPLLDRPGVSLTRGYRYDPAAHMIRFSTQMTIKQSGKVIQNQTLLYPLELKEIQPIIEETGLMAGAPLSTFDGDPWHPAGPALIMALRKA